MEELEKAILELTEEECRMLLDAFKQAGFGKKEARRGHGR